MSTPVFAEHRSHYPKHRNFGALYVATMLLSLHWAVILYINSSFLSQFITPSAIGVLYTAGSALTILIFLFVSRVLRRVGNYKLTLALAVLELCTLLGMAFADSLGTAIPLFMLHHAIVPLILFNLDVYMEEMVGQSEGKTGGRRGLMLGIMSFAGAVAPLASGYLVAAEEASFGLAYFAGAVLLIPFLIIIIRHFRTFSDPQYSEIRILSTLRSFWEEKDIRNVFFAHFHLQLFFTWMVIYTPLYLATEAGFNWSEIGIILFAGLMAYVFFEYPIGVVADRLTGEKEIMLFGFALMALATAILAFLPAGALLLWMCVMFLTRTGASFVESTTESYFFKHTKGSDTNIIGLFRITRPLSYIIAALLGSLTLLYFSFSALFIVLAFMMLVGACFALRLHDTK